MLQSIILLSFPIFYVAFAYCLAHSKRQILFIFCLFTITISSIRWNIGSDWDYYYDLYLDPTISFYTEKGYYFFSSICSNLGINYNIFLALLALPWILLAYLPISRLKLNYQASCVYFVALYSLSFVNFIGGRQQVAIALLFSFMLVRSFISKVIIVLIGFLFHSSFLLFLLILYSVYFCNGFLQYLVKRIRQLSLFRKPVLYFILSFILMIFVIWMFILSLPILSKIIISYRTNYVDYFALSDMYTSNPAMQAIRTVLKMSFYILPPLISNFFISSSKLDFNIPKNMRIFSFYALPKSWALTVIITFLFLLTIINPNIGGRLELYVRPFLAVQVSLLASLILNSRFKFTYASLLLLFGLYSKFILSLFTEDWYLPYTTILFN